MTERKPTHSKGPSLSERVCGLSFVVLGLALLLAKPAMAQSEDACAIWLCLPAGFPQGCASAHNAFLDRVRSGRSPLPDLSSCTEGPANATFEQGFTHFRDRHENCPADLPGEFENSTHRFAGCAVGGRQFGHWIEITVDGQRLGRYYYDAP